MPHSSRLDKINEIELNLAPRHWAIMLADEMRSHANEVEFLQAIARLNYRKWPFTRPQFALREQADRTHPGRAPEAGRARQMLSCQLRGDFHRWDLLIYIANTEAKTSSEVGKPQVDVLRERLSSLLYCDEIGRRHGSMTELIKEDVSGEVSESEGQRLACVLHLLSFAPGSERSIFSQAREWAEKATALLVELHACQATVELLQEKYFEGHEILWRDSEERQRSTIQYLLKLIGSFNDFLALRISLFGDDSPHEASHQEPPLPSQAQAIEHWSVLRINTELTRERARAVACSTSVQWKGRADFSASMQILQELGEEELVEQKFREKYGAKTDGKAAVGQTS